MNSFNGLGYWLIGTKENESKILDYIPSSFTLKERRTNINQIKEDFPEYKVIVCKELLK